MTTTTLKPTVYGVGINDVDYAIIEKVSNKKDKKRVVTWV